MQDFGIILGHYSLFLALALAGWGTLAALLGVAASSHGLQRSAERGLIASASLTWCAGACLVHAFLRDDFRVDYVYFYSSTAQAIPYKIAALWGGQAGSLLLWAMVLAAMIGIMIFNHRRRSRALMPWVTAIVGVTLTFFLALINIVEPPFRTGVLRADGVGLNPQLKNYWMMIHPPTLYLGYVAFTIPFAFAISALITRRSGDSWFRTTRRWTIAAWFFLGTGILMGSYWAYVELGWGGYWAWDPVENASLMPWLTATAFLHSVMIQEKKGMLKVWNVLLIILTFSLAIFGTFLTRSGIISSVHSFATSGIGPWFGTFLAVTFFASLILLIYRLDDLKSEAHLESVLSRESSFVFNNLILVGIAATVLLLTTFPILSELATGRKVTMGPPIFNLVNVPWALALLLLAGIGPLIAWRKASAQNLRRHFTIPGLASLWLLVLLLVLDLRAYLEAIRLGLRAMVDLDLVGVLDQVKVFYPSLAFAIGTFVLVTIGLEFFRGTRVRHRRGESWLQAAGRLVWRNKRRYGGYIVHAGVVSIFFGIAASAAYQKELVRQMLPGDMVTLDSYLLRYEGHRLEAVDDHLGAVTEVAVFDRFDGRELGRVFAEQRFHPNLAFTELRAAFEAAKQLGVNGSGEYPGAVAGLYELIRRLEGQAGREVKTPSTEVAILSSWSPRSPARLGEDLYVMPLWVDPLSGQANFRLFVNPMVNFIWLGGLIFVIGSIVAVFPDAAERQRLAGLGLQDERAVA